MPAVFDRLTVVEVDGLYSWCQCSCGSPLRRVRTWKLLHGHSTSCGCKRSETCAAYLRAHLHKPKHGGVAGGVPSPEYLVWANMKERCLRPSNKDFHNYGGRGITICDEWRTDFGRFLADMGRRPSPELTIERRDNDGHYEPGNCYWASRSVQAKNQRRWLQNKDSPGRAHA